MSKDVTVGLVGFGGMGRAHAEQLRYLPDVAVRVVVESDQENQKFAKDFYKGSDVSFYSNLDDALSSSTIPEGWIVASSTTSHIPITEKLLKAKCTVLLEKPIANSLAEAQALRPLVRQGSTNLMMGHILLWHREFRALMETVRSLGTLSSIRASRQRSQDHRTRYPNESPFTMTMVHDLYSVLALRSGARPIRFAAQQQEHQDGGVDNTHGQIWWADGLLASLHANFLLPDGLPHAANHDELELIAAKGMVRLNYESGYLSFLRTGSVERIEIERPSGPGISSYFDDALRNELVNFVELVRGRASVPVGARYEDACQVQSWIENFIYSAESGVVKEC